MELIAWFVAHWMELLTAIVGLLSALIAVFMLIPGEQPEKALQAVLDILKKFSIKK